MPFTNPIIAGTKLIREAIQSPNYVPATEGWSVNRDGSADFSDVSVRGPITVTGTNPNNEITISTALGSPYMQFTDQNNVAYQMKTNVGPTANLSIRPNAAPNSGLHFVAGEGIALRSDATGAPSVLFDDDDGYLKRGVFAASWTETDWTAVPALQNSWVADTSPPQYLELPDGTIRFRGWIKNGTTAVGTTLFTMPVGLRPQTNVYFMVAKPNNEPIYALLRVTSAGVVDLRNIGTSATASISLDHVSYSVR